jgi:hypothetical protein
MVVDGGAGDGRLVERVHRADVVSWVAVIGGFVASVALAVAALAAALCGVWDGECTTSELRTRDLLALATAAVYFGVPVAVALWRQQARWLLAPIVEAAGLGAVVAVLAVVTSG